jgi:hypothetical protein
MSWTSVDKIDGLLWGWQGILQGCVIQHAVVAPRGLLAWLILLNTLQLLLLRVWYALMPAWLGHMLLPASVMRSLCCAHTLMLTRCILQLYTAVLMAVPAFSSCMASCALIACRPAVCGAGCSLAASNKQRLMCCVAFTAYV